MQADGIELLKIARRETGLPIVTEIMGTKHLPLFEDVDMIQVGARNMQNFDLLKELGKLRRPILLKRGLANNDPLHALCDGAQSLRPEEYAALAEKVRSIREVITK